LSRPYSLKGIIRVLVKEGFVCISTRGSHSKYRKITVEGRKVTTVVPISKKEIPLGTLKSISRQSGLSKEKFD